MAYPLAPVGANAVGGAEQVLAQLDRALADAGHRSIVIARADSETAGELIPIPKFEAPYSDAVRKAAQVCCLDAIERVLITEPVDFVHMHGIDFQSYLPSDGVPVLATLHLPVAWYPPEIGGIARPRTFMHCVSDSQRSLAPFDLPLLPTIHNGIPDTFLSARAEKHGFVLAMGRICPEKGYHHAFDAAKRAGLPLRLAGEVFPYESHQRYFEEEIVPRTDAGRAYIGPAGMNEKIRLLASAQCLAVSSLVHETSSLVAMEALACGTPVVAFRFGALPDIIEHGVTGFIVDDIAEMAEAMKACAELSTDACRESARERFSLARMVGQYFEVYRGLAEFRTGESHALDSKLFHHHAC